MSVEQIVYLHDLKQRGIITEEEFLVKKNELLGNKQAEFDNAKSKIKITYVWMLAFTPLMIEFILYILREVFGMKISISSEILIGLVINFIFVMLDEMEIEKSDLDKSSSLSALWIFLMPVYFIIRAKILKEHPTYLWCWIFCLILSCLIGG